MKKLTTTLSSLVLTLASSFVQAQDLGEAVYQNNALPTFTMRGPVFAFLDAANGSRSQTIQACTQDGGYIEVDIVMQSEISAINYAWATIGEQAYSEYTEQFRQSMVSAFQTVAAATHGLDIVYALSAPAIYQDQYSSLMQNIATVKDYEMGREESVEDGINVSFFINNAKAPGTHTYCPQA
ncbi:MAG: hypothetical protein CMH31_03900 [Micavibrio sp.]|nr:hypothetical protein [Micavibrio sp.]|tara:strand:+ start:1242 stop:1787 length:546 start_codon:yes stop_codon:yes gene_type:complete